MSNEANCFNSKKKKAILVFIPLTIIAIVIGVIGITYANSLDPEPILVHDEITLTITQVPPYALDHSEFDFLEGRMDHQEPSPAEFQKMLLWASQTENNVLLEIQNEVYHGAIENNNSVSVGEKVLLEIIEFTVYAESCSQKLSVDVCAFYDINLQQARYDDGEIDKDQFWLNVRQYASEEVIAEIEGN